MATIEERQQGMRTGDVGGDATGADVEGAENVTVGKGNRQTVRNAHMDDDNRQQVVNVGGDGYQRQRDRDQLRIEQKMDQVLYRLDNIDRRVQQIELAMQFGGGKTSQSEKLLMLVIGGAALLTLVLNLYAQVLR